MNKNLNILAFLLGLTFVVSGAAIMKQMGEVSQVHAAGLPAKDPILANSSTEYSIDWYTIDAGGGVIDGSGYQITATIGQPDAGTGAGGTFTLQGGFLPGTLQPWHSYLPVLKR